MKRQLHYITDKDGKVLMEQVVELPDELADEFIPPTHPADSLVDFNPGLNNLKENK